MRPASAILQFGLGEIVLGVAMERAIALGAGNIRLASGPHQAMSGQGLEGALPEVSKRARRGRAAAVLELPRGSERSAALRATAPLHVERAQDRMKSLVAKASKATVSTRGPAVERKLRDSMPEDTPAQMHWATAQSQAAYDVRQLVNGNGGHGLAEATLQKVERGFDATTDRAKWFGHARRSQDALGTVLEDPNLPDGVREPVEQLKGSLQAGTTDTSLFGDSADIWDDLSRAETPDLDLNAPDRQLVQHWENLADVHERRGTAPESTIHILRDSAKELRGHIDVLDEIRAAASTALELPVRTNLQEAADWSVKTAARILAGVIAAETDDYQSPLDRFADGYDSPESSYDAKRYALLAVQRDPSLLVEILAVVCSDLAASEPQLLMEVAGRLQQAVTYLVQALPPGPLGLLVAPNGSTPARSAIRQFAVQWTSVLFPEAVLESVRGRTITRVEMDTLRGMHPDIFDDLQRETFSEIGLHFRSVPTATKSSIDQLFGTDGAMGPMYSRFAQDQIAFQQSVPTKRPGSFTPQSVDVNPNPTGVQSIQSSVTNKRG